MSTARYNGKWHASGGCPWGASDVRRVQRPDNTTVGLLNSDSILHGGYKVQKETHVFDEGLKYLGISSVLPAKVMASEMCYVVKDDGLPTNPFFPSTIIALFNLMKIEVSPNAIGFLSGMDGIHAEGNAFIPSLQTIKMHIPPPIGLQEVAIHLVASSLTR